MVQTAATIWRDFVTDGIPASGAWNPRKVDIREWATWVEAGLNAGTLNGPWKASLADLNADLAHDADTVGFVYDTADIGTYVKSGASGSGSWTKILDFIPGYQIAEATDDGNSTANAYTMNTSPHASASDGVTLIHGFIPVTNTSETVTITLDGGTALAFKTGSNNDPAVGGLVEGMPFIGKISGSGTTFRLLSDQASAAIVAQAEAEKEYAELWAQSPDPIPPEAGGDGSTDRSSKWWAQQAQGAVPNTFVTDKAALRAVDTGSTTAAYVKSLNRQFLWDNSDLSSTLILDSATTTSVDDTTETATSAAHGLLTGMPVVVDAAVNGLSTNTIYYVIKASDDTFQLADSLADAAAGTPRDLTGTTNFTVSVLGDPEQADYVIKPGDALDGSDGAWVGDDSGAPQGSAIGGLTYLRLSTAYKDGNPMLPEHFGVTYDSSAAANVTRNVAGLRTALQEPFDLKIPGGKTVWIGDEMPLSDTGCKNISGRGTIRTGETGHRFFTGGSITGLRMEGFSILGTSPTNQEAGSSSDDAINLSDLIDAEFRGVNVNGVLGRGLRIEGGADVHVYGGDYSGNLAPIQFGGVTRGSIKGIKCIGNILDPGVFGTGIQLLSTNAGFGLCNKIEISHNLIGELANAQAILVHSGTECWANFNRIYKCTHGISFSPFDGTANDDILHYAKAIGNDIDCDVSAYEFTPTDLETSGQYGISISHSTKIVRNPVVAFNTIRNVNQQAQKAGHGGMVFRRLSRGVVAHNQLFDNFYAAIVDANFNEIEYDNNIIDTVDGPGGVGKGTAYLFKDGASGQSKASIRGGEVNNVSKLVDNENSASDVDVDPSIRTSIVTDIGWRYGEYTFDPGEIATGGNSAATVTVPGAAIGDFVARWSADVDISGFLVTTQVLSGSVKFLFHNVSGATDLPAMTLRVWVGRNTN